MRALSSGRIDEHRALSTQQCSIARPVGKPEISRLIRNAHPTADSPNRAASGDVLRDPDILAESQKIAGIGSWLWNPDTIELRLSDGVYELLGLTPADFSPSVETVLKFVHPEDRRAFVSWITSIAEGGDAPKLKLRVVRPDGASRWLPNTARLDRHTQLIRGTSQDITQCTQIEHDLSASLDYSQLLFEVNPTGVLVCKSTGPIVLANHAAAAIIGGAVDEIQNQNFRELASWRHSGMLELADEALATNRTTEGSIECRSSFGKDLSMNARMVPFNYGAERFLMALCVDATEKKQIEQQKDAYLGSLKASLMQTVGVIRMMNEIRDPYTSGHERRVGELASAIGRELGLDDRRQEALRVAGYMHDIGKIAAPAEILAKPGQLTPYEFALIKEHARIGYEILKNVEFPWPVAEVALQHHERMDGSGYPNGLKGDQIDPQARIVAIADVVESMVSHRPYRPALGTDKALDEIKSGRGTLYDAAVVDACIRLFCEKRYEFPN